jgi:hypothetical protein
MIWPGWQKPHWATSLSSHACCTGWSGFPTLAARPSMVVILSVALIWETGTAQVLNALPLMWHVQAWQTPTPQPYFGPWTPRRSFRTHSSRTSPGQSTLTRFPLRMNVYWGTGAP